VTPETTEPGSFCYLSQLTAGQDKTNVAQLRSGNNNTGDRQQGCRNSKCWGSRPNWSWQNLNKAKSQPSLRAMYNRTFTHIAYAMGMWIVLDNSWLYLSSVFFAFISPVCRADMQIHFCLS